MYWSEQLKSFVEELLASAVAKFQSVYWSEQLRSVAQAMLEVRQSLFQSVYWSEQLRSLPRKPRFWCGTLVSIRVLVGTAQELRHRKR